CYGIVGAVIYRIFACGASRTVGVLALLGYAAHPFIVFWSGNYWDSYVALAMFFCALRIATILPRIHRTAGVCGAMGGLLGFLSLTNASWLLSYPLLILYGLRGRPISTRLAGVAAAALAWGIVLTPWTIRNYVVFHRLFYVRGDLGFELDSGNHPYATGWIDPELADFNPYFNTQLRNQVLSLGEMRFYDQCAAEFRRHYAADRGAFWDRVLRRAVYIFLSDPTQAPSDVPLMGHRRVGAYYLDRLLLHAAVATLGLAGVWTAWRLKLGLAWIAPVALATQLPLLVTFVDDRYVLPLRIVLTSFAAVLIWAVGFRLLHKRWPATATQSAGSPQASVAT
ncbi:MAG TPA: hypothetical protein VL992_14535, partial [Tepidisphaeraceae bacterium]|nr:hypothetical protein [Tepidisphaeraceae bacterium]